MKAYITIIGNDILCSLETTEGKGLRIAISDDMLERLNRWSSRYDATVRTRDPSLLAPIGSEIFNWLDESGWASE